MRTEPGASRSEAIRRAIQDYLRRKRMDSFRRLAGSNIVDTDWRAAERQELQELRQHERRRKSAR